MVQVKVTSGPITRDPTRRWHTAIVRVISQCLHVGGKGGKGDTVGSESPSPMSEPEQWSEFLQFASCLLIF